MSEMQRAQLALAQRTADRQDQVSEAQIGRTRSQTATEESERARTEAMQSSTSDVSRAEQAQMRALLEGLQTRRGASSTVGPLLQQLDGMSAEQINELERSGPSWLRDLLGRNGRAGGGAGGGGGGQQARTALRSTLIGRGMSEQEADATLSTMRPRDISRAILGDQLTRGRGEITADRVDARAGARVAATEGSRSDADVRRLGTALDTALPWRQAIRRASAVDPTLLRATFLAEAAPAGFTPEQIQAARAAVNSLRGTLAQARSGAAVSEPEFERITREMGASASSSPQVFLEWLQAQEQNESERAAHIRARFGGDIVSTYDANMQREEAPTAPGAAPTEAPRAAAPAEPPPNARRDPQGNVVMVDPEGNPHRVPPGRYARRHAQGWRVQGGP